MKKQIYILILLIAISPIVFSQRQLVWSDTLNSTGNYSEYFGNDGNLIKVDALKNTYTAVMSDSLGLKRILVSKHDSLGNQLWSTLYHTSPSANDWLASLAIDDSNNVFVGGAAGVSIGQSKLTVLKLNGINGQLLWSYYSASIQYDFSANDIKFDGFGNVYACGNYYSSSTTTYYYNVTKLDMLGNLLNYFNYSANTANYGYPNHMAVDSLGNVYFTAQSKNLNTNSDDGAILKLDQNLNQIWIQTYDGPQGGNDYFYDLELDVNQCPIIAGCSGQGTLNSKVLTLKYSENGSLIFSDNFSVNNATKGTGRVVTSDSFGNIFTGAETDSSGIIGFSILKYDSSGTLKSHTKITPNTCQSSMVTDIVVGSNFNTIVFGYFTNGLISKGIIIELDSNSVIKWLQTTNGSSDASFNSGIVDELDNIYICGSLVNGSNNDLIVQKYSPSITLGLQGLNKINRMILYPNPSSKSINIKSDKGNIDVLIYDSSFKLIHEHLGIQNGNISINIENFESGFYFIKVGDEILKLIKN